MGFEILERADLPLARIELSPQLQTERNRLPTMALAPFHTTLCRICSVRGYCGTPSKDLLSHGDWWALSCLDPPAPNKCYSTSEDLKTLAYAEGANAVCLAEGILPDDRATKPSKLLSTINAVMDEESDDDEYLFTSMLDYRHYCS